MNKQPLRGLTYGFSRRIDGDMRDSSCRSDFLKAQGATSDDLILCQQVHGSAIRRVFKSDRGKNIPHVDGLLYKHESSSHTVCLGVRVADCVPILLVDPRSKVIAAVHAGWRGTAKKISSKIVSQMGDLGAKASDIVVIMGPHIGSCCYNVSKDVSGVFTDRLKHRDGKWFLDLAKENVTQLVDSGIRKRHIDVEKNCTSCQNDMYFSFRKDTDKTFGEIMGYIFFNNMV